MCIAVLGAGLTGALCALELAAAGRRVDLFDRDHTPIRQASFVNEGKLHLGFVYANDRSERTAQMMVRGALAFKPLITRWIESRTLEGAVSDPFIYALHRDSMLSEEAIVHHFRQIETICNLRNGNGAYVAPLPQRLWRKSSAAKHAAIFDDETITASFDTEERSIDVKVIAVALRQALIGEPNVNLRMKTNVISAQKERSGRISVRYADGAAIRSERYDAVINATLQNRPALDASVGIRTTRPLIHRYKAVLHTRAGDRPAGLPTVTFVTGAFGDCVAFPNRAYASWYPAGLLRTETRLQPSGRPPALSGRKKDEIIRQSLAELHRLMPSSTAAFSAQTRKPRWNVEGGYISAWGDTGIEDARSELHERHAIGVTSNENFHSIDTGKYTTAPLFAAEACAKLLKRESVAA